jgi:hypothetical protein
MMRAIKFTSTLPKVVSSKWGKNILDSRNFYNSCNFFLSLVTPEFFVGQKSALLATLQLDRFIDCRL